MTTKTILSLVMGLLVLGNRSSVDAQTQREITEQACGQLRRADAELNRVYQQILAAKAGDAVFVKALREAQRAWIAFRDAHVSSIYPDTTPMAYGSANPMCRCGILEEVTGDRLRQLQALWVEGSREGNICAGSSVIKPEASPKRKD